LAKSEYVPLAKAGVDLVPGEAAVARDEDAAEFFVIDDPGI